MAPNPFTASPAAMPDKILVVGGGFAASGRRSRPGESPVRGQA